MENYSKGKCVTEELERSKIPINGIPENFLWMQVKSGSKMINLLSHVSGILEDNAATAVVWTAVGTAIPKAISCAEICKRQFSVQHQVTKLIYTSVKEHWEPKTEGLETIIVKRQIPVIHIMLTKDPLSDSGQLGYQSSEKKLFWQCDSSTTKHQQTYKTKKPFKHRKSQNVQL